VQTKNKVGFVQTLIYHMKQMECGVIGDVSSRVPGLGKQPKNQKGLSIRPKKVRGMVWKTSRGNSCHAAGRPYTEVWRESGRIQEPGGKV